MTFKVLSVVGARSNFTKVGPVHRTLEAFHAHFESRVVHTGQHYDDEMSDVFFRQIELPGSDVRLGVGSASHAVQTARIMEAFEPVVEREEPDLESLDSDLIVNRVVEILAGGGTSGQVPPLWDGRIASRMVEVLEKALAS